MKARYQFDLKKMTADCEANYLKLTRLIPSVLELAERAREQADSSGRYEFGELRRDLLVEFSFRQRPARLALQVIEQCRFTTTLTLTMAIEEQQPLRFTIGNSLAAELTVRMYHDVRMAEVTSIDGLRAAWASYDVVNDAMFHPDEKAQQNRFLGELLSLSLHRGLIAEPFESFGVLESLMNVSDSPGPETEPADQSVRQGQAK